jgi:hypothetical protein
MELRRKPDWKVTPEERKKVRVKRFQKALEIYKELPADEAWEIIDALVAIRSLNVVVMEQPVIRETAGE